MTQVAIVGNLASDVDLRFTPQGKAVANFSVAVSKRIKDGNEWKDGPPSFYRCALWDQAAENLAESMVKGQRVIVVGEIAQRNYEHNGDKRSTFEVTASEVGPSLRWAVAKPEKAMRSAGKAEPDPWGAPTFGNGTDEPPF